MEKYNYEEVLKELYKGNDIIKLYKYFNPIKYDKILFENSNLSLNDIKILCEIGFPRLTPTLNFKNYNEEMLYISSRYERGKYNKELKKTVCLGFGSYGDYIGINLETNEIMLFNHENKTYRKRDTLKINNSIEQLFKSIIRYNIFIIYKNSSIYNLDINKEIDYLKEDLQNIDKESFNDKRSFWAMEIENLINQIEKV